jgi:hypothetical protein
MWLYTCHADSCRLVVLVVLAVSSTTHFYCKQRNYIRILHHLRGEKETSWKISAQRLVSCAHRSLVIKKNLANNNVMALESAPYSLDSSLPDCFLFPWLKSVLKRQQFARTKEGIAKALSTERVTEKLSRHASEALEMLAKVCYCPTELLWRKSCVNRSKATYFCAINQFKQLLKLTWLPPTCSSCQTTVTMQYF